MSDDEFKRAMELQRKAFEAQFGSLEDMGFEDKTKKEESDIDDLSDSEDNDSSEDDVSDSEGSEISDDDEILNPIDDDDDDDFVKDYQYLKQPETEQQPQPKVIKFKDTTRAYEEPSKADLKLLKSGKAPSVIRDKLKQQPKKQKNQQPLSQKEKDDIHDDIELQRFLQESHILSSFQAENSGVDITLKTIDGIDNSNNDGSHGPIGKSRKYTLDSRLKEISSTNKVSRQKLEKMPIAMRKGMIKARQEKIAKFEQDAKDGGIILSKVKKGEFRNIGGSLSIGDRIGGGVKKKSTFREKGLKIHSIGKSTRNGLVISQREIDKINNSGERFKGKGKKGRGSKR